MKRRANRGATEQRLIAERYGVAQRSNLYKRLSAGQPFGLFVVGGRLSMTDYPSVRCAGLQMDCPTALVGIYTEMPSWTQLIADLGETERLLGLHSHGDRPS